MSGIKDQVELEALRRKLYERGVPTQPLSTRTPLTEQSSPVSHTWSDVVPIPPSLSKDPRSEVTEPVLTITHDLMPKKRRTYRTIVLLMTLLVFILVVGVTGVYMFFGNNQISNKNISLTINGPSAIAGGDVLNLEMDIANDNQVPIDSAVLIVHYPSGTKSAGENSKDLLEDRIVVGQVVAGESVKIPVSAVVFGEENQEQTVTATIEYRVTGSNGTFYKEATPFNFKINSSPIVIRVESLKKVSSGQEVEVTLQIQSNSPNPIKDVLVTAQYPTNFDFSNAVPAPEYREGAWLIGELKPERTEVIKIKGAIVGQQSEEFQIKFAAGTPKPENQFEVGSVLANASADFIIEQPFINVGLVVNGVESEVVTLKTGEQTEVEVKVRNTLTDTLYDMAVEVLVKGNILVRDQVKVSNGYYDSVKDVIRFDPSGNADLTQVSPGETVTFKFVLGPGSETATPAFTLTANALARRVSESDATEQLVGTAKSEVKFTSAVAVSSELGRGNVGFTESGPFPPVADAATTYSITLIASAGGNDVGGATLVTALPQYVNWQNQTSGDGSLVFNPVTKELTWTIGDMEAGKTKQTVFQVSILPSQTQIGTTPAILSTQRFRATDRFTGDVVRAEAAPLSTELSQEAGYDKDNGVIRKSGEVSSDSQN